MSRLLVIILFFLSLSSCKSQQTKTKDVQIAFIADAHLQDIYAKFEDNDYKTTQKTKGDYNVNNFVYGLSSYVGYRALSLYCKYDLNPIFQDNLTKENNISLGLRLDLN